MGQIIYEIKSAGGTALVYLATDANLVVMNWSTTPTGDGRWTETYNLAGKGTPAAIVDAVRDVEKARRFVDRYWADPDYDENSEVWLYSRSSGEEADNSEYRTATIYSLSILDVPSGQVSPLLNKGAAFYRLTIVRGAWKNSVTTTQSIATFAAPVGMSTQASGNYSTLPGYIKSLSIKPHANGITMDNCWIGIRPNYTDATQNFYPNWQAEWGTLAGGAALVIDADASGAAAVTDKTAISYTLTATSTKIDTVKVDDVATAYTTIAGVTKDPEGYEGRYLVLARLKTESVSAGVYTGIIIKAGSGTRATSPEVFYELTTSYDLYEIGEVEIRPGFGQGYPQSEWGIELWVRTTGAALVLHVDDLILMPSVRMISATNTGVADTDEDLTAYSPMRTRLRRVVRQTYDINGDLFLEYDVEHTFSALWDIPAQYDGFYLVAATNGAITEEFDCSVTWQEQFEVYNEAEA